MRVMLAIFGVVHVMETSATEAVDHTTEYLIIATNLLVFVASIALVWATMHDFKKALSEGKAEDAKTNRLLIRLIKTISKGNAVESKHKKVD